MVIRDPENADMKSLAARAMAMAINEEQKDLIENMYWKYVNDISGRETDKEMGNESTWSMDMLKSTWPIDRLREK